MSVWVGLGIAAFLLLLGMLGLLGGGFVVFQQVRKRNASRAARARRAALEEGMPAPQAIGAAATPQRSPSRAVAFSTERTDPRLDAARAHAQSAVTEARENPAPSGAQPAGAQPATAASPTLLPDVDDFEDDVPTGVFRPSQYQDIDAMMKEADKYVSTHRKGS